MFSIRELKSTKFASADSQHIVIFSYGLLFLVRSKMKESDERRVTGTEILGILLEYSICSTNGVFVYDLLIVFYQF